MQDGGRLAFLGFGRRDASEGPSARPLLRLALLVFLATGCGSGGQDSPQATLDAFYQRVADQKFGEACELIDPDFVAAIQRLGGNCAKENADEYDGDDIKNVVIDADQITTTGDVASLTSDAVAWPGEDEGDDDDGFDSLVKKDGKWYLTD